MSIEEQNDNEVEQDFEAAFNDEDQTDEGDTEQAADESGEDEIQSDVNDTDLEDEPEDEGQLGTEDQAQADSEDTTDDEAQADDSFSDVSDEDKPKAKSWEGRLRKREDDLKRREEALENKPETQVETDDDTSAEGEGDSESNDDDGSELAEALQDFPELAEPLSKLISKEVSKATEAVRNEFQQQLTPVTQKIEAGEVAAEEAASEAHFNHVVEQHPDFNEIIESKALNTWIDNLPHKEAVKYEKVCNEGTANEVVEMLDRLKSDRIKESKKDDLKSKRDKQKEDGAAVPRHSSRVSDKAGKVDINDFDAGFDDD